jgi:hypothetical protein
VSISPVPRLRRRLRSSAEGGTGESAAGVVRLGFSLGLSFRSTMSRWHAALLLFLHGFCGALVVADECAGVAALRIFWWLPFFSGDGGDSCGTRFPNIPANEGASCFFFLVCARGEINDTPVLVVSSELPTWLAAADCFPGCGLHGRRRWVLPSSPIDVPWSVDVRSTFMFHLGRWAG